MLYLLTSFLYLSLAPKIFVNGGEVKMDDLLDNDINTCVNLPGYYGCDFNKVKYQKQ